MAARKRTPHRTANARKRERASPFRALSNGLYELRLGARVVLDLLVTLDGDLMTFIRVDGALLGELPVLGEA
jgi:hypothetical protein